MTASACGSSGASIDDSVTHGPDCAELCTSAKTCASPPDPTTCETSCSAQRELFNQSAWDAFSACIEQDSCKSSEDCMHEAALAAPSSVIDGFLGSVCGWALRCGTTGTLTLNQCLNMLQNLGSEPDSASAWDALRVVKSSAMSCMNDCVQGLSCGELDFGKATAACGEKCGFKDVADTTGASADAGANDTCAAQHGDCGDHGTMTEGTSGSCACQCDEGYVASSYECVPD